MLYILYIMYGFTNGKCITTLYHTNLICLGFFFSFNKTYHILNFLVVVN